MKHLVLLLCVLAPAAAAQVAVRLSLDSAIAIGRQNSRTLQMAEARSEAAAARAGEASTALLPSLKFAAGYQRLQQGDFRLFTTATLPFPAPQVVANNVTLRVGIQQPLFTGFRLREQARVAEFQAQASERELSMNDADLVLNITSAYWGLVQSLQVKLLMDDNVGRLESYRQDTERMVRAGMATRNDLLKVEVQLQNARINQIDARNEAALAEMGLNNLVGLPLETHVEPSDDPLRMVESDPTLALVESGRDSLLAARAHASRDDLRSLQLQAEAARAGASAARGGYWPSVELTANYSYLHPNARYRPVIPEFYGSWDVGVNLLFDVWNWGRTARQVEQAEAGVKQAEQSYALFLDNVTLEVRRAALTVRRSREKLDVARLGVAQAEENLRVTSDRYRSGLATSSELLDAEVALEQTNTNMTGSMIEYALARARLERAVGRE